MTTHRRASCGLDFGTSNSSIGHCIDAAPRLVEVQHGRVSIPTAIFFSSEDGGACFGHEAVAQYLRREEGRFMRSLKGVLGSSLMNEVTHIKGRRLRFLDIVSMFIAFMREVAGHPDAVVLGRPVHFVDDDEDADRSAEEQLKAAAQQAGFAVVELQFEPIAAALHYERSVSSEQLAFVVDIGGGTSDFSIVRVSPDRHKRPDRKSDILGYAGIHIGGTDFDRLLELQRVMPHLGLGSKLRHKNMQTPQWWYHDLATWHRINFMYEPRVATDIRRVRRDALEPDKLDRLLRVINARKGHALLGAVEQVKIALSERDATDLRLLDLADIGGTQVTRAHLDEAIGDAVARIVTRLRATLQDAAVTPASIDAVFLTGGSSKLPLLQAEIRSIFANAEIVEGDAFGSVATGLTIDAHGRFGA